MNGHFSAVLALALCTSSCFVESSDSHPARGSLIVDWTINGQRDPDQCDQGDAQAISVIVYRANGVELAEYQAPCRAFVVQIELSPGVYSADAALLDGAGVERTTVVNLDSFEIFAGEAFDIPIDFPASSFR